MARGQALTNSVRIQINRKNRSSLSIARQVTTRPVVENIACVPDTFVSKQCLQDMRLFTNKETASAKRAIGSFLLRFRVLPGVRRFFCAQDFRSYAVAKRRNS